MQMSSASLYQEDCSSTSMVHGSEKWNNVLRGDFTDHNRMERTYNLPRMQSLNTRDIKAGSPRGKQISRHFSRNSSHYWLSPQKRTEQKECAGHIFTVKGSGSTYLFMHLNVQPVRHLIILQGERRERKPLDSLEATAASSQCYNRTTRNPLTYNPALASGSTSLVCRKRTYSFLPSHNAAAFPSSRWPVFHIPASSCTKQ